MPLVQIVIVRRNSKRLPTSGYVPF
jgi:hypothetical protein